MSRIELARSSKGLIQRVEGMLRATLPRQARVTAVEGNSVWVRFLGEEATDPEAKFVSTVAGVPVATMGWVITLGGKKGLFIATGVRSLKPLEDNDLQTATISSSQTFVMTPTVTFDGLTPNKAYTADITVGLVLWTTATSGLNRYTPAARVITASGPEDILGPSGLDAAQSVRRPYLFRMVASVTATEDGTLTFSPAVRWASGTITTRWGQIAVTLH